MTEKYRHWCFTLNNYSEDDLSELQQFVTKTKYYVYGKETGDAGTPHLQGFLSFSNQCRVSSLQSLFSGRAHWEVARNPIAAAAYCRKEGDFKEGGTPPTESRKGQGKRSDLEVLVQAVNEGQTDRKKLRQEFPGVCAKYPNFVTQILLDSLPVPAVPTYPLRLWQQELMELLKLPPDPRKILFVVDFDGNAGKSWYISYHAMVFGSSISILPGKKADMVYAFISLIKANTRVVFIDCPRSKQGEYVQYDFLEELKNGRVFNTKYESRMVEFKAPHVVVMMNEYPDEKKLSSDRFEYIKCEEFNN